MNKKTLGAIILASAVGLIWYGVDKITSIKTVEVQGTVLSEKYVPGAYDKGSSNYRFSIDTEIGRKFVYVVPSYSDERDIITLELLIERETKISIFVPPNELNEPEYTIPVNEIYIHFK